MVVWLRAGCLAVSAALVGMIGNNDASAHHEAHQGAAPPVEMVAQSGGPFDAWLVDLKDEARGRGISEGIIKATLDGIKPIPRIIELDRRQPEGRLTFTQYLERVVTGGRVKKGRELLAKHGALLDQVAAKYGVQKRFIVSLWGIETSYGGFTGGFPVINALATLAHDGRRSAFFRKELLLALEILEQGHIAPGDMKGSWAGAMGQSQFMPSSFHAYALDGDGDGDKDIWTSLPDVFSSIANYLARSGWRDDETWGRAVALPANFDRGLSGTKQRRSMREWESLGVRKLGGGALPSRNLESSVIIPQKSALSPSYLAYNNYRVILKWNRSTYFALAVGTLADRLAKP